MSAADSVAALHDDEAEEGEADDSEGDAVEGAGVLQVVGVDGG